MCNSTAAPSEEATGCLTAEQAACAYPAWYLLFCQHALRSRMVPLPPDFVEYLLSDGVYVGGNSKALPVRGVASDDSSEANDSSSDGVEGYQESSSTASSLADWSDTFPELSTAIDQAIQALGGQVVPKLNWSCPIDAVWVNPLSSLACDNAAQVVLMLKSSDRVVHDLEQLSSQAVQAPSPGAPPASQPTHSAQEVSGRELQPVLVLRKWNELSPEREWRCFVRNHQLVGVSQRDPTQHFPQLCSCTPPPQPAQAATPLTFTQQQQQLPQQSQHTRVSEVRQGVWPGEDAHKAVALLQTFHQTHIQGRFPLTNYCWDAYVTASGVVKLVDFNPVGPSCSTSPLLFTWQDLGLHETYSSGTDADVSTVPVSVSAATVEQVQLGSVAAGGQSAREVLLKVVTEPGLVHPGHRAATGMPLDMLGLQDGGVQDWLQAMQQQQRDGL